MIVVGLTGPTGAGKSELCAFLSQAGLPSINADKVYHDLLSPPSPCLDALVKRFGSSILEPDGTLDRRALASIVFSAGAEKAHEELNTITHKFVKQKMFEILSEYSKASCRAVILDVPLLFESSFDRECDLTVAILADKDSRIERIMKRDNIEYFDAVSRVNAQQSDDFYISRADIVIRNDLGPEELEATAQKILLAIGEHK